MTSAWDDSPRDRRSFLKTCLRAAAGVALGGLAGGLLVRPGARSQVWQIDPDRCVQCGRCATHCVLTASAVKCIHAFDRCGYCTLCGGYHAQGAKRADSAAESQLCPAGALRRKFIEPPFYEYSVIEERCVGCGRCVKGCAAFGNGSLYLQIRRDLCLNCSECSIAVACPGGAIRRVPFDRPYLLRGDSRQA